MGPEEIDASTDVIEMSVNIIYYQKEQAHLYVSLI